MTPFPRARFVLAALSALPAAATAQVGPPETGMVDLGGLSAESSYALAISADGRVIVGYAFPGDSNDNHAVRWADGTITDLGTLGGARSIANGISADGAVISGNAMLPNGDMRAFRWQSGAMQSLGTLGGDRSFAEGISRDGIAIVGYSMVDPSYYRAFRWTAGDGMIDLGTLGGDYSMANAVSSNGAVVVGYTYLAGNSAQRAFRWSGGVMADLGAGDALTVSDDGAVVGVILNQRTYRWTEALGLTDIGTLGGNIAYLRAMSADGAAFAGYSVSSNAALPHAFHWSLTGGMTDLGTLGGAVSDARAISADGSTVVGESDLAGGGFHAYRWRAADGMVDLGTLDGGTRSMAMAVSADGSVVTGYSDSGNDLWRAFVYGSHMLDLANSQLSAAIGATQLQVGAEGIGGALRGALEDELYVNRDGNAHPLALRAVTRLARSGDASSESLDLTAAIGLPGDLTLGGFLSTSAADSGTADLELPQGTLGAGLWLRQVAADRSGLTWRLALAHVAGDAAVTRSSDLADTEAGHSTARVSATVANAEIGYGLRQGATLWTPYLGLTRTTARVGAHVEEDTIDFPISYGAANLDVTTLALGTRARHDLSPGTVLTLWAAVEHDLQRSASPISATSSLPGMTAFTVTPFAAEHETRLSLEIGFERDLGAGGRLGGGLVVAQTAFGNDPVIGLRLGFEKQF
ncbi:MAG: hypothetical protein KA139_03975 [Rhodobacteraceae bacterium]|nr:hypothetical protein [Paracoccaceae bacterium]